MFHEQDDVLLHAINKCLALSNIIRGFSFLPGNERILCKHLELLKIIAKLLRLFTNDNEDVNEAEGSSLFSNLTNANAGSKQISGNIEDVKQEVVDDKKATKLELTAEQREINQNHENRRQLLIEMTNHLRDDAFAILAHISVQVNFCFLLIFFILFC